TAQVDRRNALGVRAEHLVDAEVVRPVRFQDRDRAGLLEPLTQLRSARLVRVERLLRFATLRGQPLGRVARTLLAVLAAAEPAATETVRLTILLVMPHRPAGRLRERDRDDLPAYLRQPGLELGLGREIGNRDHRRLDRTAV